MVTAEEALIPTVSFSLAAIVLRRRRHQQQGRSEARPESERYVLVHEKPPRGWWLPGGGVEHHDETPVHAAVRESVEEAGTPSLLALLRSTQTVANDTGVTAQERQALPTMTHLISLEQSPGRIRFIFRGEWIDDHTDNLNQQCGTSERPENILKCPPGDEDSIEAKWMTYDEVLRFDESRHSARSKSALRLGLGDPWLRGHEPITFFGMLELSGQGEGHVPGLPVNNPHGEGDNEEATGAFFWRMPSPDQAEENAGLMYHERAALLTHLQCRLLVYNEAQRTFAVDPATNMFPISVVHDQDEMTLKQLVDRMVSDFASHHTSKSDGNNKKHYHVGLLRVEHAIHADGREATLTVFPFIRISVPKEGDSTESANQTIQWVPGNELSDRTETKLAEALMDEQQRRTTCTNLDILRANEGPRAIQLDVIKDVNVSDVSGISDTPHGKDAFLDMVRAQYDDDHSD